VVAVHCVEAPGDARDRALAPDTCEPFFDLLDVGLRRARRCISPVEKAVNRDRYALSNGRVDQCKKMRYRAMDLAVGEQTHEMQRPVAFLDVLDRACKYCVACELARGDVGVDDRDTLRDDAAAAEIHVPDLAVAHDALR